MGVNAWALTDLTGAGAPEQTLTLLIDFEDDYTVDEDDFLKNSVVFTVAQYTATFAENEIPRATCLVAVGRDVRSQGAAELATIHKIEPKSWDNIHKARVYFEPRGQWSADFDDKRLWNPDPSTSRKIIFDGYYVGPAIRKTDDKINPVIHLWHWLAVLGFSSMMSYLQHPSNPADLVAPAGAPSVPTAGGAVDFIYAHVDGLHRY